MNFKIMVYFQTIATAKRQTSSTNNAGERQITFISHSRKQTTSLNQTQGKARHALISRINIFPTHMNKGPTKYKVLMQLTT